MGGRHRETKRNLQYFAKMAKYTFSYIPLKIERVQEKINKMKCLKAFDFSH